MMARTLIANFEVENKYTIKLYGSVHGIDMGEDDVREVEFKDHSGEFTNSTAESSTRRKRAREIDLPEQCYINIHAAITGVLHMSGAGKFLDELLDKFGRPPASPAVPAWEALEKLVIKEQMPVIVH
jgi:hypothetical protein